MHGGRCTGGLDAKLPGKRSRREARCGARRFRRLLLVLTWEDRRRLTGDPTEWVPLELVFPNAAKPAGSFGRSDPLVAISRRGNDHALAPARLRSLRSKEVAP